eukprot:9608331-Lingulodinium_polyedra.AAC.1
MLKNVEQLIAKARAAKRSAKPRWVQRHVVLGDVDRKAQFIERASERKAEIEQQIGKLQKELKIAIAEI